MDTFEHETDGKAADECREESTAVILDEINELETAIIELATCPLAVQILVGNLADRYQRLARIKRRLKE